MQNLPLLKAATAQQKGSGSLHICSGLKGNTKKGIKNSKMRIGGIYKRINKLLVKGLKCNYSSFFYCIIFGLSLRGGSRDRI